MAAMCDAVYANYRWRPATNGMTLAAYAKYAIAIGTSGSWGSAYGAIKPSLVTCMTTICTTMTRSGPRTNGLLSGTRQIMTSHRKMISGQQTTNKPLNQTDEKPSKPKGVTH
jgi:hypothetical protein